MHAKLNSADIEISNQTYFSVDRSATEMEVAIAVLEGDLVDERVRWNFRPANNFASWIIGHASANPTEIRIRQGMNNTCLNLVKCEDHHLHVSVFHAGGTQVPAFDGHSGQRQQSNGSSKHWDYLANLKKKLFPLT